MKRTKILLAIVLVIVLVFALVACSKTNDNKSPQLTIGKNGNWFVDGIDTGISVDGSEGAFPYIDEDGNLWIGDEKTDFNVKESVHIHQFDYTISYDGGACALSAVCECKEKIKETISESTDLKYVISEDYTYYTLTGIGNFEGDYIRIPATINEIPVKEIAEGAFYDSEIKGLIIEGNIEAIPSNTFNIPTLEFLVINSELEAIELGSFAGCENLSYVKLPNTIKHIAENSFAGTRLFEDKSKRENGALYIGNYLISVSDTYVGEFVVKDGTTLIADGAFNDCTTLKSVVLPSSVTEISKKAFFNCSSLTTIDIKGSIVDIKDGAFYNCRSLKNISIPNGVETIGTYAFYNCVQLSKVNIPASVETIGTYAFAYCNGMTSLNIAEGVKAIGDYAFANCTALSKASVPSSTASLGSSIFKGCIALEELTIPFVAYVIEAETEFNSGEYDLVYEYPIGYYFGSSSFEGSTATSQAITYYYNDEFRVQNQSYQIYYLPNGLKTVTVLGTTVPYGAFENCENLTNIVLSDGLKDVGNKAFKNCSSITNMSIPSSVETIGSYAYASCLSLNTVSFDNKSNNLQSIGSYAFAGCSALTSISIPNSVTILGDHIFDGCEQLTWTISLNANGGDCYQTTINVKFGAYYDLPTPTKTGYDFEGWFDENDNRVYSNFWSGVRNRTYTAKWTAKTTQVSLVDTDNVGTANYTATFNLNGASGTAPQTQTITSKQGLEYPSIPTRSGYVFAGWYDNQACTGTPYDFSAEVTRNITLYAKWVPMVSSYYAREFVDVANYNSYSNQKSFVVNGTSSSYANYYYFTCYNEGTYTFNATLTSGDYYIYLYNVTQGTTIISNYNMYGSYSSKSATFTVNAGDVLYVRLYNYNSGSTGSGTFYVSNASYPDAGGRTSMAAVYDTVNLTYDQSSFTLVVPTKEGYVFVGWFDGVGGTGVQYTNENGVSVRKWDKEENTVLYAKWRTIY